MKNILEEILFREINELKKRKTHGQKILNLIKGDPLHFIVLEFLYSHKIYKHSVMYGGSALKIIYGLPRMSVDLDFQINFPLHPESFKKDIIGYFQNKYGYDTLDVAVGNEGKNTIIVKIAFPGLDKFKIPDIRFAILKVRLDFNKFKTENFQQVLIPIRNAHYNFNLRTYPISTLMASKVAAVLNRVQYGVSDDSGESLSSDYKGRDIYDLIWYLQKGVIPNLRYLELKGHDYKTYSSLFKKLRERLTNLGDAGKALKTDLSHLYLDPQELDEWMHRWNEFFLKSLQNYSFVAIKDFQYARVMQNFETDVFSFKYYFQTDLNQEAVFVVVVSDNYMEDFPIKGFQRNDIKLQIASGLDTSEEKIREYAGLFYSKIEHFLKCIGGISPRPKIQTKLIQYGHGGYDPDTMIALTDKELVTCHFEDLL